MKEITLSVHQLVDFVLRESDIDNRVFNLETMSRGTQMHAYYQAKQNNQYIAEYYLEHQFRYEDKLVTISGRADGIIVNDDHVTIEEIKTTTANIYDFFEQNEAWHLGQAQCYALMFALEKNLVTASVQLTYISQTDEEKLIKVYNYTREELEEKLYFLFKSYFDFYHPYEVHQQSRDISIDTLSFPFSKMRSGQQQIIDEVSSKIEASDRLFINAPTGIGKTMAVLYPAVQTFKQHENCRVFYFTAKGSGKLQALEAMKRLGEYGLTAKTIVLNAKEKMCINSKIACNPDECPFARGYYRKVKDAITDIFTSTDHFTQENITEYGRKHEICPFEFQLDLSLLADVIIADYNYLFDPFVYLRRYFESKNGYYVALIDEAHNLPRRVSESYSYVLDFNLLFRLKTKLPGLRHAKARRELNKIAKVCKEYQLSLINEYETIGELPPVLENLLIKFISVGSEYMRELGANVSDEFRDFFFGVNRFLKMYELFDKNFALYTISELKDNKLPAFALKCLNPTPFLEKTLKYIDSAVFFSATLQPLEYYRPLLAINDYEVLDLVNPFPKENLLVIVDKSVSLFYKDRDETIGNVYAKIKAATSSKVGNYIVFCPSFTYLRALATYFMDLDDVELILQTAEMNELQREIYLEQFVFQPNKTTIGLAVVGGSFSEGVDLRSDRLSGVVIIGVGFPAMTFERELEKEYFNETGENGFNYAYIYPALNKILQTMGRVIRSEHDQGFVLLIDRRYGHEPYRKYLQNYNGVLKYVTKPSEISSLLSGFFLN